MAAEEEAKARGYLHETFRMFHNTDILGTDTPTHFHTFYKVTFVKYGMGSYMIDGRLYEIQSGDIILVGINVPHRPFFKAGELYDRYTLYISAVLIETFDIPGCHMSGIFSSQSANVIRPDRKYADRFIRMLERIETERQSGDFGAPVAAELGVIWFLIEAARCRQDSSLEVPLTEDEDDPMMKVLRYINANLKNSLEAPEMADSFGMKEEDMRQDFREAFGCPLEEYIENRRLALARSMINEGTAPTTACYECGYESFMVFSEAYRKKYGKAPKHPEKDENKYDTLSDFFPE